MKRIVCVLALLLLTTPAWAAKKLTVQQLGDLLTTWHQQNKSDEDTATELKEIELNEELTHAALNKIVVLAPGTHSMEQIYVLEAKSAMLAPPASDLPNQPAPDADAQKTILDKAAHYTSGIYGQLPRVTATKTTLRFQDNMEVVEACSGISGCAKDVSVSSGFSHWASSVHYINSTEATVVNERGSETVPPTKDKTPWGENGMIALLEAEPSLGGILPEALASASTRWLRWELVYGRPAAVYSFKVAPANSRLAVDICCFPTKTQMGSANFYNSFDANLVAGQEAAPGGGGGVVGNFQTSNKYDKHFKATVPYHGEVFVDPASGIVLRLIIQSEFKASDELQQEDRRIDYDPVMVGGKALVLPVKTVVNTVVVPNGVSGSGTFSTRHTLFLSEYKNYQAAQ